MKAINIKVLVTQVVEENYFAILADDDPLLKIPANVDAWEIFQDSRFKLCDTDLQEVKTADTLSVEVSDWTPADELEQRR